MAGPGTRTLRTFLAIAGALRELVTAFAIAVLFALFVRTFVFQAFKIPSSSMEQNLLIGDHILVNKFIFSPAPTPAERLLLPERRIRRGDIVVFRYPRDPRRDFIKRCLGLPGDTVEIVAKRLRINGRPVEEGAYTYFAEDHTHRARGYGLLGLSPRDNFGPQKVPPGEYFCLGDNRDISNDSRFWGTVPADLVKGRALLVYWSAPDPLPSPPIPPTNGLQATVLGARSLLDGTRWERSFRLVR